MSVAGCASEQSVTAPQPAPANYAQLTATYFASTFPTKPLTGAAISPIQPAIAPQPAEWVACVKLAGGETYAMFFTNGAIMHTRSALSIDRCTTAEGYAPFPAPAPPAKPAQPAKGKTAAKR